MIIQIIPFMVLVQAIFVVTVGQDQRIVIKSSFVSCISKPIVDLYTVAEVFRKFANRLYLQLLPVVFMHLKYINFIYLTG